MTTLRLGIVGAGRYTTGVLLSAFRALPEVDVSLVCNSSLESARTVAETFAIPSYTARWEDVTDASDIDAVLIGTPPYLHRDVAIAALGADKHVLCQTRIASTLAEARQMKDAADRATARAALVPPAPYLRGRGFMSKLLADGYVGRVRQVFYAHFTSAFVDSSTPLARRQDHRLFGELNPLQLGLAWDVLSVWFGNPRRVLAHEVTFTSTRLEESTGQPLTVELPDAVTAIAEVDDGALIYSQQSGVAIAGENQIVIHGDRGTLVYKAQGDQIFGARKGERSITPLPIPPELELKEADVAASFVQLCRGELAELWPTFSDGLRNMEYLAACHLSAREGRWVRLSELST